MPFVVGAGARKPMPECRGRASAADVAQQRITAHFAIFQHMLTYEAHAQIPIPRFYSTTLQLEFGIGSAPGPHEVDLS